MNENGITQTEDALEKHKEHPYVSIIQQWLSKNKTPEIRYIPYSQRKAIRLVREIQAAYLGTEKGKALGMAIILLENVNLNYVPAHELD